MGLVCNVTIEYRVEWYTATRENFNLYLLYAFISFCNTDNKEYFLRILKIVSKSGLDLMELVKVNNARREPRQDSLSLSEFKPRKKNDWEHRFRKVQHILCIHYIDFLWVVIDYKCCRKKTCSFKKRNSVSTFSRYLTSLNSSGPPGYIYLLVCSSRWCIFRCDFISHPNVCFLNFTCQHTIYLYATFRISTVLSQLGLSVWKRSFRIRTIFQMFESFKSLCTFINVLKTYI